MRIVFTIVLLIYSILGISQGAGTCIRNADPGSFSPSTYECWKWQNYVTGERFYYDGIFWNSEEETKAIMQVNGTGTTNLSGGYITLNLPNIVYENDDENILLATNGGITILTTDTMEIRVSYKFCGEARSNARTTVENALFMNGTQIDHSVSHSYHRTNQGSDGLGCSYGEIYLTIDSNKEFTLRSKHNSTSGDSARSNNLITKLSIEKL